MTDTNVDVTSVNTAWDRRWNKGGEDLTCPHGRPISMGPCWICEEAAPNNASTSQADGLTPVVQVCASASDLGPELRIHGDER